MATVKEILEIIDNAIEPGTMDKKQARDFLEELVTDVESRIDALTDEIEEDEDDGD